METLRKREDMPDLATVLAGVNGSGVIPALQKVARDHGSGWILNQKTVPEEKVGELDLLAGYVRAGRTVYIDHVGNVIVTNPTPVGENA